MASINLIPKRGVLSASIFDNPYLRIPPTLCFAIEIPVRPIKYEGRTEKTSAVLEFIDFGVDDWRELPGRKFAFPKNPGRGYVDASLYLGGAHHWADVSRIQFGALKGRTILPASLDIEFDFAAEGLRDLGRVKVRWSVDLAIDPPTVDAVCEEARRIVKKRRK
jgi:hypothetical protein